MNERAQTAGAADAGRWTVALPALAVTLCTIIVLYRQTAMSMVETWSRSETYTHGFLVPPIALWLIWRIRHSVATLTPRPNLMALLALGVSGFFWLLGEMAAVGVVSQYALTTMLILAVPAVLGVQVAWRIAFPLAFLYFAVPFGEFALPQMIDWTADFTVLGLRLSGIPVFREGTEFVIPSGNWSVVEACSGVRYLIASLTVGTLFAYLSYRSLVRRLAFVAVSVIVPLIANWVRAYMIVMLGHLSGNKIAVGVDHLIYGWLFFGIVIMAMFWIGSRWREDGDLPQVSSDPETDGQLKRAGRTMSPIGVAAASIAVLAAWPLAQWQIEHNVPEQVSRIEPLDTIDGWTVLPEGESSWTPHFANPAAVLRSGFSQDGQQVGLYLAYYRNQGYDHKLVSSSNVLVASADPQWRRVDSGVRQIAFGEQPLQVRTAELRSGETSRMVVWQLYWINGYLTSSDYVAKAYTAFSRLLGRGDDSAVIIVYAPKELSGDADTALQRFVAPAAAAIESALNRTREMR